MASEMELNAARDLIDAWCAKHAVGMPPVTARDRLVIDILAIPRPVPAPVGVKVEITAYEMQVLIGTTVSGCNMPPDRIFDLPKAWESLRALGLIDRTDGLAIATDKGRAIVLSALTSPQTSEAGE